MSQIHIRAALLLALVTGSGSTLPAAIVFSYEAAGVQQTTVAGTITENFESYSTGAFGPQVSPIGTYSAGGAIVSPDAFGGANQSRYLSVGVQSGAAQYELSFSDLKTYFGFYWGAGDGNDFVDFYEGSTLKATFSVGDIIVGLSPAYFGNPNTGQNAGEPYVYVNFTSTDLASRFDRVVFRQPDISGGFETDNHSVHDELIVIPGVPEPSSFLLMSAGIGAVAYLARRRRA